MRVGNCTVWLVSLIILAAGGSFAAPPGPPAPAPPLPGAAVGAFRSLQVGPTDSTTFARKMRGKMNLVAVPPKSLKMKSAEFGIDGRSIGRCPAAPFRIDFNSTTASDGPHVIKAVGRDEAGKEIWSASVKVEVVNSTRPPTAGPDSRPGAATSAPPVPTAVSPKRKPGSTGRPENSKRSPRTDRTSRTKKPIEAGAHPLPAGLTLDRTYSDSHYGFSIKYPGSWTFKDETVAMKPKSESDFWIQFASYPIEKASLVVNVRRVKLEEGTDAQRFATYNTYVKAWESKTVLDSPAFANTSRVLRPKPAVIHRLIIIKEGHAWMLNCTDHVGKSPDESLGLLEAMVATITSPAQIP